MSEQDILGLRAADYKDWLKALKTRLRQVQLKAAVAVNQELLSFYGSWAPILSRGKRTLHGGAVFSRS